MRNLKDSNGRYWQYRIYTKYYYKSKSESSVALYLAKMEMDRIRYCQYLIRYNNVFLNNWTTTT